MKKYTHIIKEIHPADAHYPTPEIAGRKCRPTNMCESSVGPDYQAGDVRVWWPAVKRHEDFYFRAVKLEEIK